MAKYTPKANDIVHLTNQGMSRYVVLDVDAIRKTARVKTMNGPAGLITVEWSLMHHLDESQNALRVVREATGE